MKASERYFMAIVDLISARDRLQRIIDNVKGEGAIPSIELMADAITQINDAMVKTHRDRLSDRRHDFCQIRDCGGNGRFHLCLDHAGDEIQRRVLEESK